jgi:hypothetical protein
LAERGEFELSCDFVNGQYAEFLRIEDSLAEQTGFEISVHFWNFSDEQSLGEFQRPAPDSLTALFCAEAALVYFYYLNFFLFTRS